MLKYDRNEPREPTEVGRGPIGACRGGLWIFDPKGKKLGRIAHGASATTNLAFGGDDWKTLYFTSRNHLGAVNVKISGLPVPARRQ